MCQNASGPGVGPAAQEVLHPLTSRSTIQKAATLSALAFALVLVPAALAGKGAGGGHHGGGTGGGSCTQSNPVAVVQNNFGWAQTGSWGMPGQQLGYQVQVINNDVGCSASNFTVTVSAPSGFSVSMPTNAVSVGSSSSAYLWAYVTSPSDAADGSYPVTVTVDRNGAGGSATTYYKVYSSDATSPTLFWSNPSAGQVISGNSYMVNVSSSDDHAVRTIALSIDGAPVSSVSCDDITYICQLSYKLSLGRMSGQHTATFTSTDWMGNVGVSNVPFTVG